MRGGHLKSRVKIHLSRLIGDLSNVRERGVCIDYSLSCCDDLLICSQRGKAG